MKVSDSSERIPAICYIPVGPKETPEFLLSTVRSAYRFLPPKSLIAVLDDGNPACIDRCTSEFPETFIWKNRAHFQRGVYYGRLAAEQLNFISHCAESFEFDILLRLDADAMFIGPGLYERAMERFKAHPSCEVLGDYLYTYDGTRRPLRQIFDQVIGQYKPHRLIAYPRSTVAFTKLLHQSLKSGRYAPGQLLMGACAVLSESAAHKISSIPAETFEPFRSLKFADDGILTMILVSLGVIIEDFGRQDEPLAFDHDRLPLSPQELLRLQKAVVHSVRSFEGLSEAQIRQYFEQESIPANFNPPSE